MSDGNHTVTGLTMPEERKLHLHRCDKLNTRVQLSAVERGQALFNTDKHSPAVNVFVQSFEEHKDSRNVSCKDTFRAYLDGSS